MEKLEIFGKIWGVGEAIVGLIKTIIFLPSIAGEWIAANLHQLMPWDPAIDGTLALVLAFVCTAFWYKRWNPVAQLIGGAVGIVPIVGGILKVIAPWYMHWILFSGIHQVSKAGWISAGVILVVSLAFNAPEYLKKAWGYLKEGKSIAGKGGSALMKGGKFAARHARRIQLSDPLAKELNESLKGLLLESTRKGEVDDAVFLDRADHLRDLLHEAFPQKAKLIDDVVEDFAEDQGIQRLEVRPITEASLAHMRWVAEK